MRQKHISFYFLLLLVNSHIYFLKHNPVCCVKMIKLPPSDTSQYSVLRSIRHEY